jgi:hypothetical protein
MIGEPHHRLTEQMNEHRHLPVDTACERPFGNTGRIDPAILFAPRRFGDLADIPDVASGPISKE